MKLHEILQEGVFDSIGVERRADDLSSLYKMEDRELAAYFKTLSEEEFQDLRAKQSQRYAQMNRIWRDSTTRVERIKEKYPNDVELYAYEVPDGFNRRELTGPTGTTGHNSERVFYVRAGSDAEKEVTKLLQHHNQYARIRRESTLTPAFEKELKRRKKAARREANAAAGGQFEEWEQTSPKISEVPMPDKLSKHSSKKPSLNNPATYAHATEVYTGHPAHYPNWTADWKRRVLAVEDALIRNGKKGLQLMYASRIGRGQKKQPRGYINFFIIGADGDFVWRKYQTSGANGGNWLYMDHLKDAGRMQVTDFERMSKERQDELISQI
jgi:hypothetical protein